MRNDLQTIRLSNLELLLEQLADDGIGSEAEQAAFLGFHPELIRRLLDGEPMSSHVAREIEWAMNLRAGWIDETRESPL